LRFAAFAGKSSASVTLAEAVFSRPEMSGRPASEAGVSLRLEQQLGGHVKAGSMELKLYDTLTREKRVFVPIDPSQVRMYVCGPTVYDFAHIGNARPVIVFDVLFRLLRHLAKEGVWDGGKGETTVTYVRNITDVDDKINARAAEQGIAIRELTETTYANFKTDVAALSCLPPTVEPRATEYIRRDDGKLDMVTLIERLVEQENAYVAEGHVLFHVPSMPDYGQLSKRSLDEMIAGARVDVAPYKRNPMDFVLWKPSIERATNYPLPMWKSPCGIVAPGRPGWHIECSAMAGALLDQTFDIHGGGIDLVFPHHENEIAQSRCAFHTKTMANYWMHNGFLQVEGEKMSKSLGNFVTIRELLQDWPGEVLRLQMLMTHYRQPIDWMSAKSKDAENELWAWTSILIGTAAEQDGYFRANRMESPQPSSSVMEALLDDLNTPEAIAALRANYKLARDGGFEERKQFLMDCQFLGLLRHDKLWAHQQGVMSRNTSGLPFQYDNARKLRISVANNLPNLRREAETSLASLGLGAEIAADGNVTIVPLTQAAKDADAHVENLIARRNDARRAKDFKEADRIRDELLAMGIVLKDTKEGTTWEIAR
jgi:cysteinyl-tRNA synthetase